jgi:hypothetical protein
MESTDHSEHIDDKADFDENKEDDNDDANCDLK